MLCNLRKKLWGHFGKQYYKTGDANTEVNFDHDFSPFEVGSGVTEGAWNKFNDVDVIFHAYWYGEFSRLQAASIKSLLVTQKSYDFELWLWLDEETLEQNGENNEWIRQIKQDARVQIKKYCPREQIRGDKTFCKQEYLFDNNSKLSWRADGFRIWALHHFGGFYFDLDVMFLRDMGVLIKGPEFVYAWEKQIYANNAILYLRKGSYLNEYIANKVKRVHSTQPWKLFAYNDPKLRYMKLYSTSLFDPLWENDLEEYPIHCFDDFFEKEVDRVDMKRLFKYSFAYHWHNNWKAEIKSKSLFAQLEEYNDCLFKAMKNE